MNIICLSDVAWNFLWQRQNQLLVRFPPDYNIIYVEPSFWKALALRVINWYSNVTTPKARNIRVVSIPTVPLFEVSLLRALNDKIIVGWLRYIKRKYSLEDPVLIFYNPRFSPIVGKLDESLTCYELIDDKLEFESIPKWLQKYHDLLISKADLVTVSASYLYNKIFTHRSENVFLVGNGVDAFHFKQVLGDAIIPDEMKSIESPVLGYIGALGEWVDYELIEKVLKSFPQVQVVVIGWVFGKHKHKIKHLENNYANFHFLGRRSYVELPNYMKAFTACIIPFRNYELTRSINPTKFYEYLATGKPVISSILPELEKYKDVVHLANNNDDFLNAVQEVLTSPDTKAAERIAIAEQNDWDKKASQFIDIISKHLRP